MQKLCPTRLMPDTIRIAVSRHLRCHPAHLMISIIPRIIQAIGQRTRGSLPMLCRWRLVERLVRALLVIMLAKRIEARRCSAIVEAGRFAVSAFNVRCIHSCRPLSCGLDGGM